MSQALLTGPQVSGPPPMPPTAPHHRPGELVEADLLLDAAALAERIHGQVEGGHTLDGFLLAAGLNQVAQDFQHRDPYSLGRVAALAARGGQPWLSAALRWWVASLMAIRAVVPAGRRLARWQTRLATLVDELAEAVVAGRPPAAWTPDSCVRLAAELCRLPAGLAGSVLRLPSCFRVLDQRPEDSLALARQVWSQLDEVTRPLLVVGVRTSGSYLAPLLAASLRMQGATAVEVVTIRPGVPLLAAERRCLRAASARGATAVLCDDPPASGAALERAAETLVNLGFADPVVAVPLLEGVPLPERLRRFRLALLPAESWHIATVLAPEAARLALQRLLPEHRVLRVERLGLDQAPDLKTEPGPRRHRRGLYSAQLLDGSGRQSSMLVYCRGVGLGWLGRHALAAWDHLSGFHPQVLGICDGVLYREWMPEERRLLNPAPEEEAVLARRIAGYVAARASALPAAADKSLLLAGRQPVWQRVADLLGRGFGRARPAARIALHRAARRLLSVERPSVVDASMALGQWFWAPDRSSWVKVDYDERAFSNEDLTVYDPVYDLAVAASDAAMEGLPSLGDALRQEYQALIEKPVEAERLALYRLQHLSGLANSCRQHLAADRAGAAEAERIRDAAESEASLVMTEYLAGRLLHDVEPAADGPLCAIDIDGVLETSWLGFSCPTPLGVLVIRALAAHGYRPVLASGRSLPEVRARSRAFRLAGGVAEYGAVVWLDQGDWSIDLLDSHQIAGLNLVRSALLAQPGVHVDGNHRRVLRAYRLDGAGRRRGLEPAQVEPALTAAEAGVRHVAGWAQSDFVPAGMDKGVGLRRLLSQLGRGFEGRPLAFAAGDTGEDAPMFSMASLAASIGGGRYQTGLAAAATRLLGHRPGSCRVCRAPRLDRNARLLLAALSAQDAFGARKLMATLRLAREVLP